MPKLGKGEVGLDKFIKQIQKNKSDIETEKITDGCEGEEIGKITVILIGIFDEMKDLMK